MLAQYVVNLKKAVRKNQSRNSGLIVKYRVWGVVKSVGRKPWLRIVGILDVNGSATVIDLASHDVITALHEEKVIWAILV